MRRILSALIILTLGSFVVLTSSSASADTSASATATVTVGSACTLNSVLDTPHTATIPSGTNQSEIGKTTFTVVCNNTGGYSIYAVGYSNFEIGNTKLLANINGALNSNYDINTGTNASGTPSSWAMKLTPSTNLSASNILNGFGSYSAVPSSYVKVATLVPTTTMVNTSSLEATYRVNIASTQPAGNYNGKVRYVMVDPNTNVPNEPKACSENKICYWPNAGNEVTDSMGDQSTNYNDNTNTITSNMDVNLWPSNFKRTGYGFAGWSDAYDYVVNAGSESNPDAHIYGPMETIHLDDMSEGLSLYAVWVKSEGNLQNWNGCPSLGQGRVTALTDLRDNDTYAVAKLADSNCWMIENLRLDYDADFTESLSQGFGKSTTYGNFIGLAEPETANFTGSTTTSTNPTRPNSLYYAGTYYEATIIDITQTSYPSERMPRYNNNNTNITTANMTGVDANIYSYGNYYTWAAAIANTKYYDGPTTTDEDGKTSETANTSLCPAGWRLPFGRNTGNGSYSIPGGFYSLNYRLNNNSNVTNATASQKLRAYPNNFLYSGIANGSSIGASRGTSGDYQTSASSRYDRQYYLGLSRSSIYPGNNATNGKKSQGYSIRCTFGMVNE